MAAVLSLSPGVCLGPPTLSPSGGRRRCARVGVPATPRCEEYLNPIGFECLFQFAENLPPRARGGLVVEPQGFLRNSRQGKAGARHGEQPESRHYAHGQRWGLDAGGPHRHRGRHRSREPRLHLSPAQVPRHHPPVPDPALGFQVPGFPRLIFQDFPPFDAGIP